MRDDFKFKEQGIIDNAKSACEIVKAKSALELELYRQSKSAIKDSINEINNVGNQFDSSMNSGGQSDSRVKVLVRTNSNQSFRPNTNLENNYDFGSANVTYTAPGFGDSSDNSNKWYGNVGSAQTLILICTAILVVLVVAVSLGIMKYLGI